MKNLSNLLILAALLLIITPLIVSCEQETDLLNRNLKSDVPLAYKTQEPLSISNGFLKAKLDSYAFETFKNLYGVELKPELTKIALRDSLWRWVEINEGNKHSLINSKNRESLANMESPHALFIKAPSGSAFIEAVFVVGKSSSLIITDILDFPIDPRARLRKVGVGFYGDGYLDPFAQINCFCTEVFMFVPIGQRFSKCGQCPALNEFPKPAENF